MADLTSNQVCNICCVHYNAGLKCCALGSNVEGGYLFAKDGSAAWIVAPAATEVSRCWYARDDAATTAGNSANCGDWFVPSRYDLILGYTYRCFWDSFSNSCYWSSTDSSSGTAWSTFFTTGCFSKSFSKLTGVLCVRAFRKVFY